MPLKIKDHLQQRGTTWHVRLDIPVDVRHAFGNRRILSKSLKTGDKQLAKVLASQVTGQWKAAFRSIREAKLAKGDAWREQVFITSQATVNFLESTTLDLTGIKPKSPPTAEQISEANKQAAMTAEVLKNTDFIPTGPTHSFNWHNKPLPAQLEEIQRLASSLRDAERNDILSDYSLNREQRLELDSILSSPTNYKPRSPFPKGMIDRFSTYLSTQNDNQRTHGVCISKVEAFSAYLTAEGLHLSFDTVAQYLNTISAKRQTRQGHLWALRKVWKWAVKYETAFREQFSGLASPFDGHEHARVGKDAGAGWIAFTRQEAEQLHTAALAKSDTDLADLIKFASYTGCRIEELGRIGTDTTIFVDGQPTGFRVDDAKTAAGVREVPIHPKLLSLYLHRLKSSKDGYLFQGGKAKSGIRLNGPAQRFTKLKKALKFSENHVFHSLRKTTATQLQQAGASPLVIPAILGHEVSHISFETYSAGSSFQQKKEAIALLEYSFERRI